MKIVINTVLTQYKHSVILDMFSINIGEIGGYFVYFYWYLKKDALHVNFNTFKGTIIY